MMRTGDLRATLPPTAYLKRSSNALRALLGRLRLRLRMRFALDGDARRKQLARVSRILRRDPRGDRLRAFEPLAGVERLALGAGMEVGATALAARVGGNRVGEHVRRTASTASPRGSRARSARALRAPCARPCRRASRCDRPEASAPAAPRARPVPAGAREVNPDSPSADTYDQTSWLLSFAHVILAGPGL